jgi:hypothetical protein
VRSGSQRSTGFDLRQAKSPSCGNYREPLDPNGGRPLGTLRRTKPPLIISDAKHLSSNSSSEWENKSRMRARLPPEHQSSVPRTLVSVHQFASRCVFVDSFEA